MERLKNKVNKMTSPVFCENERFWNFGVNSIFYMSVYCLPNGWEGVNYDKTRSVSRIEGLRPLCRVGR